jgi:hypothetical protein
MPLRALAMWNHGTQGPEQIRRLLGAANAERE